MKIISTSYSNTPEYSDPVAWLQKISFYTGILEALAKKHEVASIERIRFNGALQLNGVHYYFMDLKKKRVWFPLKMHGLIKRQSPDVVLVNGMIFPLQLIQLRLHIGSRPRILVLHRAERHTKGWRRQLQKLADRWVHAYLFSSKELAAPWVESGTISANKVFEVMQASSAFTAAEQKSNAVFLWVGRLEANKDPLTVVKAFIRYLEHRPEARLFMIYQSAELLYEVQRLVDAIPAIRLIGRVERHELGSWYNRAAFILSGSHYEGGGTVISEAMSCGCIPLVTDIPSFRAITGGCGIRYEAGNENALLDALVRTGYMDHAAERQQVLDHFQNELSFGAIAQKINRIIQPPGVSSLQHEVNQDITGILPGTAS